MNNLQIFTNPEFGQIRTIERNGEPWFVGKDVAQALGYGEGKSLANAVANHVDAEDKGVTKMMTPGGIQNIVIINESGLYALIFSSKLESAKRFKHWVTSEVLPAIRKTGTYSLSRERALTTDDYLKAAQLAATCQDERLPYVLGFLEQAGFPISKVETLTESEHIEQQDNLVKLLNECGLTITELSRKLGIHKVCLSRYKRGIYTPRPERYRIIVEALSQKGESKNV